MSATIQARVPSQPEALAILCRAVFIEIIRRKEFYVLLILTAAYAMSALVALVVGVENPETLIFLINLGITVAHISAHILVLLTAARQIPFELENRTIYPLLAKPISRSTYLLGKWLAITIAGNIAFLTLFLLAMVPWLVSAEKPALDNLLLVQAIGINVLSIGLLASIAFLTSLLFPQGVAIVVSGLLFFVGGTVASFLNAQAKRAGNEGIVSWLTAYIPDFNGRLNLFTRYTDGIEPVSAAVFFGLILYALVFLLVTMVASDYAFRRRTI